MVASHVLPPPPLGTWPATQVCALTGNGTGDPLVHRPILNPLSNNSQGYGISNILKTPSDPKEGERAA